MRVMLVLSLLLTSCSAVDAGVPESTKAESLRAECIDRMAERTAALASKDWRNLLRLAERDMKGCLGWLSPETHATTFEQAALASNRLGNHSRALTLAQACVSKHYLKTGCHVQELDALVSLKRVSDARGRIPALSKLIAHLRTELEERLKLSRDDAKELLEARLEELDAQAERLEFLRARVALP